MIEGTIHRKDKTVYEPVSVTSKYTKEKFNGIVRRKNKRSGSWGLGKCL